MSVADKLDVARTAFGSSNFAKAICKATSREVMGPKKKHVEYLLQCTDNELMNLSNMCEMLMERCRMSSWVIVSKALVTFHSLMSSGNERFLQQLSERNSLWDLGNFVDKTTVTAYDMSSFIKRYSKYLTRKVLCYREMNYDFCRAKRGPEGVLRTLDANQLLKALNEIQTQIDSLLEVDLQSSEFSNGVINSAFVLLFKDLIKLFAGYNDGMINLLEKYYEMSKENCKQSLAIYKKFLTRTDQVSQFLTVAEDIGVSEDAIPDLAKAPSSLLEVLETHYKSLEKGLIPDASETKRLNLPPITIPVKSEQFHFNEDEIAEQFSPEENGNETTDTQHTLLLSTQSTNPGGEGPWQSLFEASVPQTSKPVEPNNNQNDLFELHAEPPVLQTSKPVESNNNQNDLLELHAEPPVSQTSKPVEPNNNQNDLLELHAVFQTQQAPPTYSFPQHSNFGASGFRPTHNLQQDSQALNPFDTFSRLHTSGDVLQPMNTPQSFQRPQQQEQAPSGDLHSSLSKVAKSLDNFQIDFSGSTGHQWSAPKPKVKTGGESFQMGSISNTTWPPSNPIASNLPYNSHQPATPQRPIGMGQPTPMVRPGFKQPQLVGARPMAYGQQQTMMQPQTTIYSAPRGNVNPFDNQMRRNQALF